jgi:hypothetical protein
MGKQTVTVSGAEYILVTFRAENGSWRADGKFRGKDLEGRGKTDYQAVKDWRSQAQALAT